MYFLHKGAGLSIYFGDARDQLFPNKCHNNHQELFKILEPHTQELNILCPIFLQQVHGSSGVIIPSLACAHELRPFEKEGDFLMTSCLSVGLGVLTADCLPIVIYGGAAPALAVVHAGWRSSIAGIVLRAIEEMQELYGSDPKKLKFFFGPCAQACCYQVSDDFIDNLISFAYADEVVERRDENIYFDLPLFNQLMLGAIGIASHQIDQTYSLCTICNESFYSHRRQKDGAGRNITIATLT